MTGGFDDGPTGRTPRPLDVSPAAVVRGSSRHHPLMCVHGGSDRGPSSAAAASGEASLRKTRVTPAVAAGVRVSTLAIERVGNSDSLSDKMSLNGAPALAFDRC